MKRKKKAVRRKQLRAGVTGWDEGAAWKVLQSVRTHFGRVYVVELVYCHPNQTIRWFEAVTEGNLRKWIIGADENGLLPDPKLFKFKKKVSK